MTSSSSSPSSSGSDRHILVVGASRGLGLALSGEYLARGWNVVATERAGSASGLHELSSRSGGRLDIETIDIVHPSRSRRCATAWRRGASTCCSSTPA